MSPKFAKVRCRRDRAYNIVEFLRGGPPKSHLRIGEFGAKKLPISTPHPASELGFLVKKSFATVRACGASIGPNTASAPETAPRTSPNCPDVTRRQTGKTQGRTAGSPTSLCSEPVAVAVGLRASQPSFITSRAGATTRGDQLRSFSNAPDRGELSAWLSV